MIVAKNNQAKLVMSLLTTWQLNQLLLLHFQRNRCEESQEF